MFPHAAIFLKSNGVEMSYITEEFLRLALAHPPLAFTLLQNDELLYDLPSSKLSQRIVNLFREKIIRHATCPCSGRNLFSKDYRIHRQARTCQKGRKEREQFIFVNERFIRNNYLSYAVSNAYEGLLQENSFPFYALFIDIDPKHIDVNVHPTKTEIKFDDERAVYGVVWSAVKQALGAHNLAPAIDFADDVNLIGKLSNQPLSREQILRRAVQQLLATVEPAKLGENI